VHAGVHPFGQVIGQLAGQPRDDPGWMVRRGGDQADHDLRAVLSTAVHRALLIWTVRIRDGVSTVGPTYAPNRRTAPGRKVYPRRKGYANRLIRPVGK
jgi:hypothetical protein